MNAEFPDHALRLAAAALIGCALGLTRDVTGKPAGMRTMALVSLAAFCRA